MPRGEMAWWPGLVVIVELWLGSSGASEPVLQVVLRTLVWQLERRWEARLEQLGVCCRFCTICLSATQSLDRAAQRRGTRACDVNQPVN
jgi:hypothetical protein